MKKKLMPLAVGAAIAAATTAQAQMYINNDGTGEMLVFPFYSAESGNSTNVNITNTTAVAKAIKIRIIEGENSQEVLDFNVYMSAEDHFSFAITATEDGGGSLVTNDNTCTVPRLTAGEAVPFRGFLYDGDKGKDDPDTDKDESFDNTSITRTATGYIEVIEMGQLDMSTVKKNWDGDDDTDPTGNPILAAITHGADGVPANCDLPVAAWSTGGQWHTEANGGDAVGFPILGATQGRGAYGFAATWDGGGLYGEASVINVGEAAAFGYDADAIVAAVGDSGDNNNSGFALHYPPGDTRPDFTSPAVVSESTVEVNGEQVDMDFSTIGVDGTVDDASLLAVSSLFQSSEVINDFVTDPGIAALTDWIITMPTKFQHIGRYSAKTDDDPENPTLRPFSTPWNGKAACEYAKLYNWDREEANPPVLTDVPDFSPQPDTEIELYDLPLCYEVNVVQFGDSSAVLNESLAVGIDEQLQDYDGWAKISFSYGVLSDDGKDTVNDHERWMLDDNGTYLEGLPVTGFAAQTYTNSSVNGSGNVANYAAAFEHRTNAVCSGGDCP